MALNGSAQAGAAVSIRVAKASQGAFEDWSMSLSKLTLLRPPRLAKSSFV
jgi:hypothetical protein